MITAASISRVGARVWITVDSFLRVAAWFGWAGWMLRQPTR